jgi:hypothetical protein
MSGFGARAAKLLSASCKALSHLIDRASQMFRDHRCDRRRPRAIPVLARSPEPFKKQLNRQAVTAHVVGTMKCHGSSALLWTFLRERPEGSGRELFALCCPYRFFIDVQTKARTIW